MKRYLNAHRTFRRLLSLALAASLALPLASLAASVTLATSPLATSTTSSVSPNLMFILDDSGSMNWNYMPDNANDFNGAYGFASNQCNGVYYDPSLTYSPPVDSTGVSYANASFTAAWNDGYNTGGGTTNLNTSFQPSSSYTIGKAFYYFYTGTQTDPIHKDYYNTAGVFYNECNSAVGTTTIFDGVNPVNTLFTKRTLATTENTFITVSSGSVATITVNTASSTFRLGQITVGGASGGDIMSGRSSSASNTTSVADNIAAKINSCTVAATGSCNVSGYSATASGNVVTISGPAAGGSTMTYNINAGSWTYTATTFSATSATAVSSINVNGVELLLSGSTASSTSTTTLAASVAAGINAAGYSATASGNTVTVTGPASAANYTPVTTTVPASGGMTLTAGTFPETDAAKLTNFANWYSYYRTRMQMMKTSTGLAFKPIDNKYRVGFMTINNNNSPDVVDLKAFDATQKSAWYAKLYAASPNNSTPLREALAKAGLFYAHKLSSNSLNSLTVRDPIQYSCQQNFTILSTDGFWNGNDGFKMDGSTAVGNQDGAAPRPLFDGARANKTTTQVWQTKKQVTRSTSQIQKRTEQIQSQTSSLQSITSTLQQLTTQQQEQRKELQFATGALQKRTTANGNNSNPTWTAWSGVATCTVDTSGNSRTQCRYATLSGWTNATSTCTANDESAKTSNGDTWSGDKVSCQYNTLAASPVPSCTPVAPSGSSPYTVLTAVDCPTSTTTANVPLCTVAPVNPSGVSIACSYVDDPAVNVSSCTDVAKSTGSPYAGPATTCSYTAYTAWANANSCTAAAKDTTAPYDMSASGGTATNCQTTDTGWVNTGSCTAGVTGGQTVTCQTLTTGPTAVASCTAAAASSGNSWTATSCTTTTVSPKTLVATCACTAGPQCIVTGGAPDYFATTCDIVTTTVNDVASCAPETASAANGYKTVTCSAGTGGTSDTLADVAMYYYQTDLRDLGLWNNCTGGGTGTAGTGAAGDVCANNVYISGADNNVKQHMTTFTLGLGARGRMVFSPSYQTDLSGDFISVKNGAIADSTTTPPTCSWQANGSTCNWPVPAPSAIENIDDLWHAAVDGRGTYFSATDPASLASGLSSALSSITSRKGSAAAAATSTLNPVAGNNFAYVASYTTVKWTGNLESRSINVTNGVISEAATWCVENTTAGSCSAPSSVVVDSSGASAAYNCVTPSSTAATCTSPAVFDSVTSQCSLQMPVACAGTMPALVGAATDTRIIKTANSAGTALVDFVYANLNSADFDATRIGSLSQWAALTATQKTAAAGPNLVNFLRGQYGFEERASNLAGTVDNRIYRYRETVMGDALESQPAYLGPPVFSYSDPGYTAFKSAKSARSGTVYMGANDGMLHAFAADTGVERWAYVPSLVIPNMWILADKNYDIKHTNFVNGSPTMSDVCVANCTDSATADWRTILVGGLNGGGRGYYALDITDPAAPALLWEFTPAKASPYGDANVGYSFGQPIITKMTRGTTATSDDTWVVLVTSGYNNTSPGDGKGYLYVLNALTGAKITAIPTNVGDTTTPSGLAKISGWNSEPASNVASYVYGGDLLGNVWRFDINSAAAPLLFATLKDPSGNPQPVTTSPVLGQIIGKRVIFVGTGKYLETSDLTNTQVQSIYAIKDDDATITFANPRAHTTAPKMVNQTLTEAGSTRTTTTPVNPVDFSTDRGWYIDFPDGGERVNIDSQLVLGTLLVPTIVPSSTVCSPGGYGWLNFFDYETGGPIPPTCASGTSVAGGTCTLTPIVSVKYDSTIVGLNIIFIEGTPIVEVVTSFDPTPRVDDKVNIPPAAANFAGKRMLWRELIP